LIGHPISVSSLPSKASTKAVPAKSQSPSQAQAVPTRQSPKQWNCSECTMENFFSDPLCQVCGASFPRSVPPSPSGSTVDDASLQQPAPKRRRGAALIRELQTEHTGPRRYHTINRFAVRCSGLCWVFTVCTFKQLDSLRQPLDNLRSVGTVLSH